MIHERLAETVIRRGGTAAFIDITGFKPFNDHYGLALGDTVIRRLGEILTENLGGFFTGHVGGDDFVCAGTGAGFDGSVRKAWLDFRLIAPGFYADRDREAGGIESFDRYGSYRFFPFLDLTVVTIRATGPDETVESLCHRAGLEKSRLRGIPVPEVISSMISHQTLGEMAEKDAKALLEAMGILREVRAVPLAVGILRGDYGWNLRKSAALSLGRIGGEEAVAALIQALSDTSPHVRTRAVEGLVLAAGRRAGPVIAPLAEDRSTWVRRAALRGLGMSGWQPGLELLMRGAGKKLPRRIDTLAERTAALEGIALLGGSGASSLLSGFCKDPGYEPGLKAFQALCSVGGDPAAEEVLRRGVLPQSIRLDGTSPENLRRLEDLAVSAPDPKALRLLSVFPVRLSDSTRSVLRRWLGTTGGEFFLQLIDLLEARGIPGDTSCAARVASRLTEGDASLDPHSVCRFLLWLSRSPGVPFGVYLKPFLRTPSGRVRLAAATALSMRLRGLTEAASEESNWEPEGKR